MAGSKSGKVETAKSGGKLLHNLVSARGKKMSLNENLNAHVAVPFRVYYALTSFPIHMQC